MVETLLLGGGISIVAALIASFIALRLQQHRLVRIQAQQEAWQRSQEMHQQQWNVLQEKRTAEFEKKVMAQAQEVRTEWQAWTDNDAQRIEYLSEQYSNATKKAELELKLTSLPHVEEVSLIARENILRQTVQLQEADLTGRDLSKRYLAYADLRHANLSHANLAMTDLMGAHLTGANLTGANLSGANLAHADLRGAILTDANLLVADLHSTSLMGAVLTGVRSLSDEQLAMALYDDTTTFDDAIHITLPRVPRIRYPVNTTPSPTPIVETPLPLSLLHSGYENELSEVFTSTQEHQGTEVAATSPYVLEYNSNNGHKGYNDHSGTK